MELKQIKVILLSGTMKMSGSTTWINNLAVGFSRLDVEYLHLIVGTLGRFPSRAQSVLYTGRSRSNWLVRLLRWIQFHKIFKQAFSRVEMRFFNKKCSDLLKGKLSDRVLVVKDFNSFLPEFFLTEQFVVVDVLHNNVNVCELKGYQGQLVAVSDTVREGAFALGYPVIKTIYNPIDISELQLKAKEYEVDCDSPYILYVGNFFKEKGVFDLLQAYASSENPEVKKCKLVYVGGGSSFNELKKQVAENDLQDRVVFTGLLENPYPWIARASLLVLPSYAEAMPYVPIESAVLKTAYLVAGFKAASEFFCTENIYTVTNQPGQRVQSLKNALPLALMANSFELLPGLKDKIKPEEVALQYYSLLREADAGVE